VPYVRCISIKYTQCMFSGIYSEYMIKYTMCITYSIFTKYMLRILVVWFFFFSFFFWSTFYNATVHNTCIAYLRQSLQVMGERGEGLYEGQSVVTLGDRSCGTQPQRTGVRDAGYGRPVRAKLRQGVGPQLRWLRRRQRSRVALNRSEDPNQGRPGT
jgi:hypothetical protein